MKWSYLLILLMNILLLKNQSCKNMDTQFCQALIDNDNDILVKVVNRYLTTLNPEADKVVNFQEIKTWLEQKSCIESAKVSEEIIETYPPILSIQLNLKDSEKVIQISFNQTYQFYDLKTLP